MLTTRAPQLTIDELIDALEAKIAAKMGAMRARNGTAAQPEVRETAARWKEKWAPRANGGPLAKRIHPFAKIEEL
jgi:hypothetical protein